MGKTTMRLVGFVAGMTVLAAPAAPEAERARDTEALRVLYEGRPLDFAELRALQDSGRALSVVVDSQSARTDGLAYAFDTEPEAEAFGEEALRSRR